MKIISAIILPFICILSAGCVVIPTDYHTATSRTAIGEESTNKIIPGESTKEDILLLLGEPDRISPDSSTLMYSWSKVKGIILMPYFPITALPPEHNTLVIKFNEKGVVENAEYQQSGLGQPYRRIPITLRLVKTSHMPFERQLARAQCGIVEAQELVATSYHHGAGVGKDLVKAATWYKIATDRDSKYAAYELLQLKKELTQSEYLEAEMAARTWQPGSVGCQALGNENK